VLEVGRPGNTEEGLQQGNDKVPSLVKAAYRKYYQQLWKIKKNEGEVSRGPWKKGEA